MRRVAVVKCQLIAVKLTPSQDDTLFNINIALDGNAYEDIQEALIGGSGFCEDG